MALPIRSFYFILRIALILLMCLPVFYNAKAQQQNNSVAYYMYLKNDGKIVDNKDSADYFRIILKPDSSSGKKIYPVNDYYMDGKIKMRTSAILKPKILPFGAFDIVFEGTVITYFKSGRKKTIANYVDGYQEEGVIGYYPNGNLFFQEKHKGSRLLLIDCRDSTGNILAQNGNGKWLKFSDDFSKIAEGPIKDSLEDGEWHEFVNDTLKYTTVYKKGEIISSTNPGSDMVFTVVDEAAYYGTGGPDFLRFLAHTIIYPAYARENDVQGTVIVTFVIEKDGSLSHITTLKGPGHGLQEETIRAVSMSPPWHPALIKGRAVRMRYTTPVNFGLSNE